MLFDLGFALNDAIGVLCSGLRLDGGFLFHRFTKIANPTTDIATDATNLLGAKNNEALNPAFF